MESSAITRVAINDPQWEPSLTLGIVTWNSVNKREEDLSSLLNLVADCDLLVIGLQGGEASTSKPKDWARYFQTILLSTNHRLVAHRIVHTIQIYVFSLDESSYPLCFDQCITTRGYGAVGIRIDYGGLSLEFVSLRPSGQGVDRISEIERIYQSMFATHPCPHLRVWLGDMSWVRRHERYLSAATSISSDPGQFFLRTDGLLRPFRVFKGWSEGVIGFRPTSGFEVGTNTYSIATSTHARIPTWDDRIIFWAGEDLVTTLSQYSSVEAITSSEHKPVWARLHVARRSEIGLQ